MFALAIAVSFSLCAFSQSINIKRFGSLNVTKQADNKYLVSLGKLGNFTFQGTIDPPKLSSTVTIGQMKTFPGYAVLSRLGLRSISLNLDSEGLTLSAQADTKGALKTVCNFLQVKKSFVEVSANLSPEGIGLRADLASDAPSGELVLNKKLGTKLQLGKMSVIFNVGVEFAEDEEKGGNTTNTRVKRDSGKEKKKSIFDITPVLTIRSEFKLQPTKFDPLLPMVMEFSYNLVNQELSAAGSIVGTWKNPLGLSKIFKGDKGIILENAAVSIGWIPGAPSPTKIGFFLERAGVFGVDFGFAIDLSPTSGDVALMASCKKLSLNDMLNMLEQGLKIKIPDILPGDIALNDFELLFSPNGGQVGEFKIEEGFGLKGGVEATKFLKGRLSFILNTDDGFKFAVEFDAREFYNEIERGLKKHKRLGPILSKVLSTLQLRRLALNLEAAKSKVAGGFVIDAVVFGKKIDANVSGKLNPQELVKALVDKIKDKALPMVAEALKQIGKNVAKVKDRSAKAFRNAGRKLREFAKTTTRKLNHAKHTKKRCMNECTSNHANSVRKDLLSESNKTILEFVASVRNDILMVEGDDANETRKLREDILREPWNAMLGEIDEEWKEAESDKTVKDFFTLGKSKNQGYDKYRKMIEESWNQHKNQRNQQYQKLLTM